MLSLRWSLFCGEPLPERSAEAWQAAAPNSIVENLYGPTELTIACTLYRWDPQRSPAESALGVVPIGAPYPGMSGFSVTLSAPTTEEAKALFDKLADGAQVNMPFGKTFFSDGFGMLVDRFGTPWMVMSEVPAGS